VILGTEDLQTDTQVVVLVGLNERRACRLCAMWVHSPVAIARWLAASPL
jgi:hypothetical protein